MSIIKKILKENKSAKLTSKGIFIPIKEGDVILRGRFRNRKVKVKEITIDEHGLPLINGSNIVNFRFGKSGDDETDD